MLILVIFTNLTSFSFIILDILTIFAHFPHSGNFGGSESTLHLFYSLSSGEYAGLRAIMSYLTSKVTSLKFLAIQNHITCLPFFLRAKETVTYA